MGFANRGPMSPCCGLPSAVTGLFEGTLLFFLLAADVFVNFRLRVVAAAPV